MREAPSPPQNDDPPTVVGRGAADHQGEAPPSPPSTPPSVFPGEIVRICRSRSNGPADVPAQTTAEVAAERRAAQVMVRDACLMHTTCYYAVEQEVQIHHNPVSGDANQDLEDMSSPSDITTQLDYRSVWSSDWIEWNVWLNKPCVHSCFLLTTTALMVNTLIEQPFNDRLDFWGFSLDEVPEWVGHTIFFVCHTILLGLFIIVFVSMWPTRATWLAQNVVADSKKRPLARATEQWWTLAFGFLVITSIVLRVVWLWQEGVYSKRTLFGTVKSGVDVVWRGFRCFHLLYLSPRMRYGFSSALYVATKLGNIAGLVTISFLFHYFLIVTFLPLKDTEAGRKYQERELFFSTTGDGLYHMFVALTTANHPDVLMPSYHREWYMMFFLFMFMAITNLFLLNVFLGVVTTQYADMVMRFYLNKNAVCEGILGSAFKLIACKEPGDQFLRENTNGSEELHISKDQFLHSIELSHAHVDMETRQLWFTIMDVDDDKFMNDEEFIKLTYIVNVGFVKVQHLTTDDEPRFPWAYKLVEMDILFALFPSEQAVQDLDRAEEELTRAQKELEDVKGSPKDRIWPSVHGDQTKQSQQHLVEQELKRAKKTVQNLRCPNGSTYGLLLSLLILLSILNSLWISPSPDTEQGINNSACSDSANIFGLCLGLLFLVDVIITFLSESTYSKPCHYLYGPNWFYNWTDIAVVVVTFVIVGETCDGGSTPSLYPVSGLLRVCRCVRMIQRIESFRRMYNAATRVIPAITPQLLLFVTSYYSFAVLGMALFAGCVTELEEDGGPGEWTSAPWSETMFGKNPYYYQHNFDNIYSSCMTLFMLMIQNNWHVTVTGYVACSGTKWVRVYFISFNVINAMILINIFVGVVLDMFDLYWHDEQYKMGNELEDKFDQGFFEIICHRLEHRLDEKGEKLNTTWEVSHEIDSGLLYSGVSPSDAVMLVSEVANRTELSGLKEILNDSPMPIYVRTSANKIAFANKVFAGLYNVEKPEDLIGSYQNYLLRCEECDGTSRCTHGKPRCFGYRVVTMHLLTHVCRSVEHNHVALKSNMPVDYTEEAILQDGTEVVFRCTEKPIEMSIFKHTTVVYMFPTQSDGNMFFDTDGDGLLSAADRTDSMFFDSDMDGNLSSKDMEHHLIEPIERTSSQLLKRATLKLQRAASRLSNVNHDDDSLRGWMSQANSPQSQPDSQEVKSQPSDLAE